MKWKLSDAAEKLRRIPTTWFGLGLAVLVIAVAWWSMNLWLPAAREVLLGGATSAEAGEDESQHHEDHGAIRSIRLSEQAKRNIGLRVGKLKPTTFVRDIGIPAMVAERPGRTHIQITAPMTGIVTEIAVVRGEAVWSDALLFRMRLSHEDLVRAQTEFLKTLGQLDAELKEIKRLKQITGGAIAERLILERQYTRDKLQAVLRAQEESLRLHGLTKEQVKSIRKDRKLAREITVTVPRLHADSSLHHHRESHSMGWRAGRRQPPERGGVRNQESGVRNQESGNRGQESELPSSDLRVPTSEFSPVSPKRHSARRHQFIVNRLPVHVGQAVHVGETLCVLADYQTLYLEGRAFEQDAEQLARAANEGKRVTAIPESGEGKTIRNLTIEYVGNEIDPQSRALYFYVTLPNERNKKSPRTFAGWFRTAWDSLVRDLRRDRREYVTWKYKPGQRMQLRVPVETWNNVLVVPVEAVATDGPEAYVFVKNGRKFERRPVTVMYRDRFRFVLANDGSVFPNETVALNGAHQLLIALKNKAGEGAGGHGHHH